MSASIDSPSHRERLRVVWAVAFWAITYVLFALWNQLQDESPTSLWQTRRLLTTLAGAGVFYSVTWLADRAENRPAAQKAVFLLASGLAGCLLMVGTRAAIDALVLPVLGEPAANLERHLRFALIWAGYFAGGTLAFLSFASVSQLPDAPDEQKTQQPAFADAFWVSRGRESLRVPVDTIEWVEAEGDYVRLHGATGGGLMRGTLSGLEASLDPETFVRLHRSVIGRRGAIVAVLRKPSGALAVRLSSGVEVPVGRSYRDAVAAIKERDTA